MDQHPTPPYPEDSPDREEKPDYGEPPAEPGSDPDPGFYDLAFQRMPRWIALVTLAALPFVWGRGGAIWGASFLVGAIGGYWNYVAIRRIGDRLLPTVQRTGHGPSSTLGFLLRLLFIGVAVFVIIRFTRINLVAAFMGLFVPVAAVVVEILYEVVFLRDKS
jgi:hypothetical protein